MVATQAAEPAGGGQVIDLMDALRASLAQREKKAPTDAGAKAAPAKSKVTTAAAAEPVVRTLRTGVSSDAATETETTVRERKGVRRAPKPKETAAPARVRARK